MVNTEVICLCFCYHQGMTISVLQWNVLFQEDIHNIVEFLKLNPADIICLQELTINYPKQTEKNTPQYVAEQLGYEYYAKEITLKKSSGESFILANGIFSRFPIVGTKYSWINKTTGAGGYDDEHRVYVEVSIKLPVGNVTFATTHMSFTPYFKSTPRKKREADELIKEIRLHNKSYIFTGDLNSAPDTYTVKEISKHLKNVGPELQQNTWTTKPFSYQGFEETERNWRLDYIFATKDIKVKSAEILETVYSDHLPIFVSIEI